MERLTDSAYDCNIAMRFNRMDVAMGYVAQEAQEDFVQRHAKWGRMLRIVDVELAGLRMVTSDVAEVSLEVSWQRADESTMRYSRINQRWKDERDGWKLTEEIRAGGSPGLYDRVTTAEGNERSPLRPPRVDLGQL
jgi:hypothetical protein